MRCRAFGDSHPSRHHGSAGDAVAVAVKTALNVGPLLRRFGIKGRYDAAMRRKIVPTIQVADASQFSSPLVPPTAWAGAISFALAGQFAQAEITARAPGGAFVRVVKVSALGPVSFDVGAAPRIVGGLGTPVANRNMGPVDVVATTELDSNPAQALPGSSFPRLQPTDEILDGVYLRPGRALFLEPAAANLILVFSFLVQDVLAPETPDAEFDSV